MQLFGMVNALIVGSLSLGAAATGQPVASSMMAGTADADTMPAYRAPLTGRLQILTPFRPPATRYGAGHLGIDLAATAGTPVLAAASGVVSFAGAVAGRGVIVLVHADGISTEYEPVFPAVRTGQHIAAGRPLGQVEGSHRACQPATCLHWGARRGARYLDPLSLLSALGVVRLVPWDVAGLTPAGGPG